MSQAPTQKEDSLDKSYEQAWISTRILAVQQGFSWSGKERNHTFLNLGGAVFADVSRLSGSDCVQDGRAMATLDWDDDGKVDFLLKNRNGPRLQFFRNTYGQDAGFLGVELVGNGTTTNRDAIGARVTAMVAGRPLLRTLYSADGFLSQSSKRLHFGLGKAAGAELVTVRWPDGTRSTVRDVPAGTRLRITQGSEGFETLAPRTVIAMADLPAEPLPETAAGGVDRAVLAYELPLAGLSAPAYDDPQRRVSDLAGSPVLLNLWSYDCSGCAKEMRDFSERRDDLEASGLRIVTLQADLPSKEWAERRESWRAERRVAGHAWLEKYGLGHLLADAGYVEEHQLEVLALVNRELFGERTNKSFPSPVSLLLDERGRLVSLYFGAVDVDRLLADVGVLRTSMDPTGRSPDRLGKVLSRLASGTRWIHHERNFLDLARKLEALGELELAEYYRAVDEQYDTYFDSDPR